MNRSAGSHELPPLWIRICSWCFLVFLASPLIAIANIPGAGAVAALGMRFEWGAGAPPLPWVLTLGSLFFAAGLTALAILMRWRWAYDFGIVYATVSIGVGALGLLAGVGGVRDDLLSAATQHVALALFLVHLVRHRDQWRDLGSSKPVHPSSGERACPPVPT